MNIVVFGATGTIGAAVAQALEAHGEVLRVSHSSGELRVDLGEKASIEALFAQLGTVDHIVSAAGAASFGPVTELDDAGWELSLGNKLMGQVNLVRVGHKHLQPGGSITLTAGLLSRMTMPGSSSIAAANAGLEAFVRVADVELGEAARLNVVSPGFVKETAEAMGMPTDGLLNAAQVAKAYVAAVTGEAAGQTLEPA